ncbi:MAG: phosphonopyruvate decarboxylase, partial [Actinobacteria bacterium]|nr:phosphonopyruvate decarboxylase [Actinomycetota bacterium]
MEPKGIAWPADIYRRFKALRIAQVAFVPDAGHAQLIQSCDEDPDITTVSLTAEQEGVALLAGAWLGGQRGALLMQSSGVGNCVNMLSLAQECRFPLFMLVTMRGEWGEFNPWQLPMGQATTRTLEDAGVVVQRVETADALGDTVFAGATMAFSANRAIAVLISQKIIGFKDW